MEPMKARLARGGADADYDIRRNVPVVTFGIACCAVTMCLVLAMAVAAIV
jgi:NADH:ubiquinone oxidoreductase subunit B-like Fe-S oxidoreductase